ncbi:MAG TPA: hypothetical protein VGH85_04420 [Mycobacteriales bacterium]|jgi:hypothetical protein
MLRRRRTLLRAAAVGGAAYHVGKKRAQRNDTEAEQNAKVTQVEQQQQMSQPSATPGAPPIG